MPPYENPPPIPARTLVRITSIVCNAGGREERANRMPCRECGDLAKCSRNKLDDRLVTRRPFLQATEHPACADNGRTADRRARRPHSRGLQSMNETVNGKGSGNGGRCESHPATRNIDYGLLVDSIHNYAIFMLDTGGRLRGLRRPRSARGRGVVPASRGAARHRHAAHERVRRCTRARQARGAADARGGHGLGSARRPRALARGRLRPSLREARLERSARGIVRRDHARARRHFIGDDAALGR